MVFDDKEWEQVYSLILISLSNSVAGIEKYFPDAAMDDRKLHFFGLKEAYVTLENEGFLNTTIDGETGPTFPAKIKVLPASLSLFIPQLEK